MPPLTVVGRAVVMPSSSHGQGTNFGEQLEKQNELTPNTQALYAVAWDRHGCRGLCVLSCLLICIFLQVFIAFIKDSVREREAARMYFPEVSATPTQSEGPRLRSPRCGGFVPGHQQDAAQGLGQCGAESPACGAGPLGLYSAPQDCVCWGRAAGTNLGRLPSFLFEERQGGKMK